MSHHTSESVERHCDVAVVGGSAAGLAAALQLGRQRRSVIVIDAGEPRNAPAEHMHSYLGYDGRSPSELIATGRDEVRSYGGEILSGRVELVTRTGDGRIRVQLDGGHTAIARRVLAASGLVDELPNIDGLLEHWGRDVIHCPFCHGYEARDRRIVVIVTHPMGLHPVALFRQLSARLTVVVHEPMTADAELAALAAAAVDVVHGKVVRLISNAAGGVAAVEIADNERIEADVVVVGPRFSVRAEPFEALGLRTVAHPSGLGDFVETDATGETAVSGVYAAGNVTDPQQQVSQAAAQGSWVGAMISFSLAEEDLGAAVRPSPNQADWDHRYGADPVWSGNPNGSLVREVTGLSPGRALDVGAGEGADALWLAEQGWTVTASDISARVLDKVAERAGGRGLTVECHHADANAFDAYPAGAFDLVSAQYASIPRTPDRQGVHNILNAVASGGTLVVVSHDLEPMFEQAQTSGHPQMFDPAAYLWAEDFVEVLAGAPGWEIEVHEKRPRPPGAASADRHVDDIVLRARRNDGGSPRGG